ncbi:MAG: sigma-54-dependent Fis family transcriptional regulator [Planctomycetes bacterium]|nr:sigma-54-dependent Fis family transcriptional regulator [Planctomycetota bacterium]
MAVSSAGVETVLVVDDAAPTLEVLERNLRGAGFEVFTATGVAEAIDCLERFPVDLVVTDIQMPAVSGIDLVRHVRENLPETAVIVITGYASIDGAVKAVKLGAEEYLAKPFTDEELLAAVERVQVTMRSRRSGRSSLIGLSGARYKILGDSTQVADLVQCIERAARSSATVLITGESGTGKELVARAIHYSSGRASAPFVPVNTAGIPEALLESSLFGHVKGAFSGADESRAGFFQTSDGGTLFLDEVASMSGPMQAKLLRVLQEREVTMVGDTRSHAVDVRILSATNLDLWSLVKAGDFREDLYFRLNVLPISVPPLRDRAEDIPLLVRHFVQRFAEESRRQPPLFSASALRVLQSYSWPGNVRELQNVVHRLVVMTEHDPIDVPDLPKLMRFQAPRKVKVRRTLQEVEREHIERVLAMTGGNKVQAALILGIDRKTLRQRLRSWEGTP